MQFDITLNALADTTSSAVCLMKPAVSNAVTSASDGQPRFSFTMIENYRKASSFSSTIGVFSRSPVTMSSGTPASFAIVVWAAIQ